MKKLFKKARSNRYVKRISKFVRDNPTAVAAMAVTAAACVIPGEVLAWSAPSSGDFLYDIYDIAVNKMLNGPLGFIGGMGCIGAGGYFIANSRAGGMATGIPMILLGGTLIKLDSITQSLGYMI